MELIVNNIDLYKATKKYEFDLAEITDEQWLKFGEAFIKIREEGHDNEFDYMIENSAMYIRFREPANASAESMIAKVNLEYLRESGQCVTLNYNFDVNGEVSNSSSELSRCWRNVMFNHNKGNNL